MLNMRNPAYAQDGSVNHNKNLHAFSLSIWFNSGSQTEEGLKNHLGMLHLICNCYGTQKLNVIIYSPIASATRSLSSLIPSTLCPICYAGILHHLTISPNDSLIDPDRITISFCLPNRYVYDPLLPCFLRWPCLDATYRSLVRPYFNINFLNDDTSVASAWPHISAELIIIHVSLLLPPAVARARARKVNPSLSFFSFLRGERWFLWI